LKQPTGEIEGLELWRLVEGRIYDVDASLATLLIVSRWAELVADDGREMPGSPVAHPSIIELHDRRSLRIDRADDRSPRRRRAER
jgi:hypothetical protein